MTPNELAIQEAEKELAMREAAARHLTGIPKLQNETAMERLCDRLTNLHIERIEADGSMTEARRKVMSRGSRHV